MRTGEYGRSGSGVILATRNHIVCKGLKRHNSPPKTQVAENGASERTRLQARSVPEETEQAQESSRLCALARVFFRLLGQRAVPPARSHLPPHGAALGVRVGFLTPRASLDQAGRAVLPRRDAAAFATSLRAETRSIEQTGPPQVYTAAPAQGQQKAAGSWKLAPQAARRGKIAR